LGHFKGQYTKAAVVFFLSQVGKLNRHFLSSKAHIDQIQK